MSKDLLKTLAGIKEDLKQLKTTQETQNDSYRLEIYRTDNLFPSRLDEYKTWRIEFIPEIQSNQVVCIFRTFDMTAMAASTIIFANNPLVCECTLYASSSTPTDERQVYVTCIANCKGVLAASETT